MPKYRIECRYLPNDSDEKVRNGWQSSGREMDHLFLEGNGTVESIVRQAEEAIAKPSKEWAEWRMSVYELRPDGSARCVAFSLSPDCQNFTGYAKCEEYAAAKADWIRHIWDCLPCRDGAIEANQTGQFETPCPSGKILQEREYNLSPYLG